MPMILLFLMMFRHAEAREPYTPRKLYEVFDGGEVVNELAKSFSEVAVSYGRRRPFFAISQLLHARPAYISNKPGLFHSRAWGNDLHRADQSSF